MSLEEALVRNNELLVEHNALITKMLGAAAEKAGSVASTSTDTDTETATTGEKKKAGRPKKADTTTTESEGGVTFDALKKKILGWLGEFAKDEDKANPEGMHPEVAARKAALAKAYASDKVKIEKLPDIKDDPAKLAIINDWFENKVKTVDKGFGIGRFAADPEPEEAEETVEEDDMDV